MKENMKKTNWKAYYRKRTFVSKCSAWLCAKNLYSLFLRNHLDETRKVKTIVELGGANSALYRYIRTFFPHAQMILIDKEEFNESAFCTQICNDLRLKCKVEDILTPKTEYDASADFVFSIGLVEHFSRPDTALMIRRHFEQCRPGGIVLISFPTPTLTYKVVRCLMQKLNLWIFHDERALQTWEVESEMNRYGTKIDEKLDSRLGLTQKILLYTKFI